MKTVLAPNAPWPVVPEAKTVIVKNPKPARVQLSPRSRIANTNERYRLWAEKNLGAKK